MGLIFATKDRDCWRGSAVVLADFIVTASAVVVQFAYFGRYVSEKQIAKACRTSAHSGTTGTNLARGAKRFGFDAEVIDRAYFRTLAKWFRRGAPIIVDWMSTVSAGPGRVPKACGHCSAVCGLDESTSYFRNRV